MRIGRTGGVSVFSPHSRIADARRVEASERGSAGGDRDRDGRRLPVPLETSGPRDEPVARIVRHRLDAPFLAQLVASHDDRPIARRRAEPAAASRVYARAVRGEGLLVPGYFVDLAR